MTVTVVAKDQYFHSTSLPEKDSTWTKGLTDADHGTVVTNDENSSYNPLKEKDSTAPTVPTGQYLEITTRSSSNGPTVSPWRGGYDDGRDRAGKRGFREGLRVRLNSSNGHSVGNFPQFYAYAFGR